MFWVILVFLRLSGIKDVSQLSILEVAIIVGLGSAAGDPMSNPENAIAPALIVFASIMVFYRLITRGVSPSERFESLVEEDSVYVIESGMFVLDTGKHTDAKDEFFAEMRQQNIEHLGQGQTVILETNGTLSFFYYADEKVKPGLPVRPKTDHPKSHSLLKVGQYVCTTCSQLSP